MHWGICMTQWKPWTLFPFHPSDHVRERSCDQLELLSNPTISGLRSSSPTLSTLPYSAWQPRIKAIDVFIMPSLIKPGHGYNGELCRFLYFMENVGDQLDGRLSMPKKILTSRESGCRQSWQTCQRKSPGPCAEIPWSREFGRWKQLCDLGVNTGPWKIWKVAAFSI